MSALLAIKENTIGQFTCAMLGRHSISDEEEDRLYASVNGEVQSTCKLCGIRLIAKVEPTHTEVYTLSRLKESE
jgi:hypothetical protein